MAGCARSARANCPSGCLKLLTCLVPRRRKSLAIASGCWIRAAGLPRCNRRIANSRCKNMLIGAMNHPGHDPVAEIEWMAAMGLEFVDLTLEPPRASARAINSKEIRAALEAHHLPVVGHTAYYLPLCSPFESLRLAAVEELKICLEAFAAIGARWMNLHPDNQAPLHDRQFMIERNLQTIRELLVPARALGVGLMIENLPHGFNSVRHLAELLDPVP